MYTFWSYIWKLEPVCDTSDTFEQQCLLVCLQSKSSDSGTHRIISAHSALIAIAFVSSRLCLEIRIDLYVVLANGTYPLQMRAQPDSGLHESSCPHFDLGN